MQRFWVFDFIAILDKDIYIYIYNAEKKQIYDAQSVTVYL